MYTLKVASMLLVMAHDDTTYAINIHTLVASMPLVMAHVDTI